MLAGCLSPGKATHITQAADAQAVRVSTEQGEVVGRRSAQGRVFLNIPYAAPPVGKLRFMAPQPPAPWAAPRDAHVAGATCMQNLDMRVFNGKPRRMFITGDEDCLNLNIYAPADMVSGEKLPVMVWLHGGGWVVGSNVMYDLSVMAQRQRLVMVAPNYRLGALGFLTLPALRDENGGHASPGLLDQQAALRWVQANIGAFGGDARNVTLFGESAGSWSVCQQLTSPAAQGLFHRAIIQSGTCSLPASSPPLAQADAGGERYASELGCPAGKQQTACLRQLSARSLLAQPAQTAGVMGAHSWNPAWGDATLPMHPKEAIAAGRFHRVPIMEGYTSDEGALFAFMLRTSGEVRTLASYRKALQIQYGAGAEQVLAAYPPEKYADAASAYGEALSDSVFVCPSQQFERLAARHTPVYAYRFDDPQPARRASRTFFKDLQGAFHASELVYIMHTPWVLAKPEHFTDEQLQLAHRMQAAWAHFARHGAPGVATWQAVNPAAPTAYVLRPGAAADRIAHPEDDARCAFWNSLPTP
ncbi:MAG: carboxylesterase family protein [Brachymonas sp.]|nr:carboxylesterase family protein [Brachymonas sp.]